MTVIIVFFLKRCEGTEVRIGKSEVEGLWDKINMKLSVFMRRYVWYATGSKIPQ